MKTNRDASYVTSQLSQQMARRQAMSSARPSALPPGVRDVAAGRAGRGCRCGGAGGSSASPASATPIGDAEPQRPGPSRPPFFGPNPLPPGSQRFVRPSLPCRFSCGRDEKCAVGQVCCNLQAFPLGGRAARVVCANDCADACEEQCTVCDSMGMGGCREDSICKEVCRLSNLPPTRPRIYCDDLGRFARLTPHVAFRRG